MIIVMETGAEEHEIEAVIARVEALGYTPHPIRGVLRTVIGAIGDERGKAELQSLEAMHGVDRVVPILRPYKLASQVFKEEPTVIPIGDVRIGGLQIIVIAGPCAVENREQLLETANVVKSAGAHGLRGGAFKPRSSPYTFQGLGEEGLKILAEARQITGLPIVTEVMTESQIDMVARYADVLQVGARNVQNFPLLRELGKVDKPILLKRGMSTTIEEYLMSAEYILSAGNAQVILCERGIRTFETATRNTLDLAAVAVLKHETHLPVLVDPSHGTGQRQFVPPMAKAAVAAGADGLLIEVHPRPEEAYSDGAQSLKPTAFALLMSSLKDFAQAAGRHL
ncbi:MAG: 3-deoxy-7-phosphoheptulonate synthase [Nitrospinota bacterium]